MELLGLVEPSQRIIHMLGMHRVSDVELIPADVLDAHGFQIFHHVINFAEGRNIIFGAVGDEDFDVVIKLVRGFVKIPVSAASD